MPPFVKVNRIRHNTIKNKEGNMIEVGWHKQSNRFPNILWRYMIPRPLLLESTVKEAGYQQYKWLWWYIVIPMTNAKEQS